MDKETEKRIKFLEDLTAEQGRLISSFLTFIDSLSHNSTIPYDVDQAFRKRLSDSISTYPAGLLNAPQAAITPPSGGATVDSQARTAIGTIITTLQNLGLTN